MASLVEQLSAYLKCEPWELSIKLSNLETRRRLELKLKWKVLRTNYNDRNGEKKLVYFGLFSQKSAAETKAMGDLRAPFNCNITQYYYIRHKIQLKYPWLLCVSTPNYNKSKVAHFPLELVTLLDPKALDDEFEENEKTPTIEEIDNYFAKLLKQQEREEGEELFLRDTEFELMRSRIERFEGKMEDKYEEGDRITKEEIDALDAIERNRIIFKKCLKVMKLKNEISILEKEVNDLLLEDYRQPEKKEKEMTEDINKSPEGKEMTEATERPLEFIDEEPFELQLD
jgi:hypothetical protein